jgi:hypothetical protein
MMLMRRIFITTPDKLQDFQADAPEERPTIGILFAPVQGRNPDPSSFRYDERNQSVNKLSPARQ